MNLNLLPDLALFVQIVDRAASPPSPARTALPLQPLAAAFHGWSERWAANCCSVPPASCVLAMPGNDISACPADAGSGATGNGFRRQSPNGRPGKADAQRPESRRPLCDPPADDGVFHRYPQVDVCLRLEDRPLDFIDDGIDLALRITDTPPRPAWQTADANQARYLRH